MNGRRTDFIFSDFFFHIYNRRYNWMIVEYKYNPVEYKSIYRDRRYRGSKISPDEIPTLLKIAPQYRRQIAIMCSIGTGFDLIVKTSIVDGEEVKECIFTNKDLYGCEICGERYISAAMLHVKTSPIPAVCVHCHNERSKRAMRELKQRQLTTGQTNGNSPISEANLSLGVCPAATSAS